jgi:dihydroorotate dehydrogenase electron transfer subunit
MQQFDSTIKYNKKIADSFFTMDLSWESQEIPSPGQFLTLRVSDDTSPLLRRPFAFSGFDPTTMTCSLIYQKRGRGTELLVGKQSGDLIDIIGPLGKSFPMPKGKGQILLVAGGIGIGPILFLASQLKQHGHQYSFIFGCRNHSFIPDIQIFRDLNPIICTDDGSEGFKGTTGDYLKSIENEILPENTIYSCGPHPMLRACHELARRKDGTCWVSVEQIMACGVGACMGCVVKTKGEPGFARACKEGPVFSSDELIWE